MKRINQEKPSQGSKAVDQLSNTLDLLSCGILNVALPGLPDLERATSDLWEHFVEIKEKLELARSLLSKNVIYSPKSDKIANRIESIADQANWLALDAAIRSAHNGWLDQAWSPLNLEIYILAERAEAVVNEVVDLFQEMHFSAYDANWLESFSTASLFSSLA